MLRHTGLSKQVVNLRSIFRSKELQWIFPSANFQCWVKVLKRELNTPEYKIATKVNYRNQTLFLHNASSMCFNYSHLRTKANKNQKLFSLMDEEKVVIIGVITIAC